MAQYAILPSPLPLRSAVAVAVADPLPQDIFTNTRPLWHPPGARGIYGGAAIAQCLSAAQATIPRPSAANDHAQFFVHSMHCYFVLAGDSTIPVLYHVERVREGKSFMTRTVQARQRGKCIFTTTLSFVREGSAGSDTIHHEHALPPGVKAALEEGEGAAHGGGESSGPFESRRLLTLNRAQSPQVKRTRQWVRARGSITEQAGPQGHMSALAYMSDSYFIGTVARVHNLWRFGRPTPKPAGTTVKMGGMKGEEEGEGEGVRVLPADASKLEEEENQGNESGRTIGMMVSLDHSIYFHNPRALRADEWLFAEMETPWAGDGRGLVFQKIWTKSGDMVATCVQEGLVRLVQGREVKL